MHCIYFALYYYYISSTSDPGGWGPLHLGDPQQGNRALSVQNSPLWPSALWAPVTWASPHSQCCLLSSERPQAILPGVFFSVPWARDTLQAVSEGKCGACLCLSPSFRDHCPSLPHSQRLEYHRLIYFVSIFQLCQAWNPVLVTFAWLKAESLQGYFKVV